MISFLRDFALIERYGLGAEYLKPWPLSYIGVACMYIAVGAVPTITMAYGNLCLRSWSEVQWWILTIRLPRKPFF